MSLSRAAISMRFVPFTHQQRLDRCQLREMLQIKERHLGFRAWASACWHKGWADGRELVEELDRQRVNEPEWCADELLRCAESAEWLERGKWIAPLVGQPGLNPGKAPPSAYPAWCFGWMPIRDRNGFCSPLSEMWEWLESPPLRESTADEVARLEGVIAASQAAVNRATRIERIETAVHAEAVVEAFKALHR